MDLIQSLDTNYCIQHMSYDFSGKKLAVADDQSTVRVFSLH